MKKLLAILAIFFGLMIFTGSSLAASDTNILQPASDITYNENLIVNGYGKFNSIRIGEEGIGGVTYFNGTIINIGESVPVTFGDDVRIDGEIWRGTSKGTSDGMPLKISDTVIPTLTDLNDLGSSTNRWNKLYAQDADFSSNLTVVGEKVWTAGNDGPSSGLNADLLDGKHANNFALQGHNHDADYLKLSGGLISGNLNITGTLTVPAGIFTNSLNAGGITTTAITSNGFYWGSPKIGYATINGPTCSGNYVQRDSILCKWDGSSGQAMNPFWNIQLPHGAIITSFRAKLFDGANDNGLTCTLKRQKTAGTTDNGFYDLVSAGTTNIEQVGAYEKTSNSITNAQVNNEEYSYFIECVQTNTSITSSNLGVYGFRVTYTKSSLD